MYVIAVNVFVKPSNVKAFIDATLENARNTRREAGNLRFDVLRGHDDGQRPKLRTAHAHCVFNGVKVFSDGFENDPELLEDRQILRGDGCHYGVHGADLSSGR